MNEFEIHRPVRPGQGHPDAPARPAARFSAASRRFAARWAWLAALCAYLLPGIVGHEPWKQDETYSFGIIHHMVVSGDWVVPTSAGQPFMEKPPLYYWLAALLGRALTPWLSLPDAARLASVVCIALTFAALAGCTRLAVRGRTRRAGDTVLPLILLAGCLGLVKHAHDLFTDAGLIAASAGALYALLGLADASGAPDAPGARRRGVAFGLLLGASTAAAFLTKGLFMPAVLGLSAALVLALLPACRNRRYLLGLGLALAALLLLALPWPVLLAMRSPALFREWFWVNNVGRFLGFSVAQLGSDNDRSTLVKALVFFAFPAGPLALFSAVTLTSARLRQPATAVPLLVMAAGLTTLAVSATLRELYLLPLLPAMSLLGADALYRAPPRSQAAWDWSARALAVLCGLAIWTVWWHMRAAPPRPDWLARFGRWLPLAYRLPKSQPAALPAALALTLGWLAVQARFTRSGALRGALSWAATLTLTWGLVFTLLLPWLDQGKNYRTVFVSLAATLAPQWRPGDCVMTLDFGESEAPMFMYYTGVTPRPVTRPDRAACRWLAVQQRPERMVSPGGHWTQVWWGARPGDTAQVFTLFRRRP